MKTWFLLLIAAALASGCAHRPERNAVVARAETSVQRAAQAYAKGDLAGARNGYGTALSLYESVADTEGRARTLLSLARVTAQAGKAKEALAMVETVLTEPAPLSPAVRIMAHGRAAGLALAAGDPAAARGHLDRALPLCAGACAEYAALTVLQARVSLALGQAAEALVLADRAMALAAAAPAKAERASALRVRCQALAALGKFQESAAAAAEALKLDQERGLSEAVVQDLHLLAQAHQALGDMDGAQRYQTLADRARAARRALAGVVE